MRELFNISNYFFNIHSLAYFISGLLIAAESIFIFVQNRKSMLNFSFSLCTIFAGMWLTGDALVYISRYESVGIIWARYWCWLGIIFVCPAVYLLSVVWREGKVGKNINKVIFNFLIASAIFIIGITTDIMVVGLWPHSWGFYPRAGVGEFPFIIWFYLLMILSFKNFIYTYRHETIPIKKKQTKLVIVAFIFGFLGSLDYIPNFIPIYTIGGNSVVIFSTIVAYAIVNYKLMDIETILHKTLLWVLSFSLIAIPIYFLYRWFLPYAQESSFLQFGFWLVSFLVLTLYLRLVQPKIDHFFQRRRVNLEEATSRFTEDLIHLKGLNQLIERIEDTIKDSLYPQRITIYIYDEYEKKYQSANTSFESKVTAIDYEEQFLLWLEKNNLIAYREYIEIDPLYAEIKEEAKKYFNLTEALVVVPLVLNEHLLGVINLSKKANLKRYKSEDFHFLTILRNQASIAISNSLLYENIEKQVRDKTKELVDTQKQLIQAEKLATVGTLAGGVAHEINNPLTAILTNIQMMLASKGKGDAEFDRESLELIEEATKRCRAIVKQLMIYAGKPLGSLKAIKQEINLAQAVKNVVDFLGYQLEQDSIKIITEIKEDKYLITGNSNEIEQVITNLVLNAKDATKKIKKSGVIRIILSKGKDGIKLEVEDEGIGISEEIMPKIFDPFFTTKEVGKGVGLGLAICQSIIEQHGGIVTVESKVNKGTTLRVKFPKKPIEDNREKRYNI